VMDLVNYVIPNLTNQPYYLILQSFVIRF